MKETIYILFVPWVFSQYQVSGRLSSVHDKVWKGHLFRCTNMSPTLLPAEVRCDGYPDCPGNKKLSSDWDWALGLGLGIGDWDWGLGLGMGMGMGMGMGNGKREKGNGNGNR